jgi:hypothetical protein
MTNCPECLKPCPEHNVTFCLTCHNHPGECEMGGCTKSHKGGTTFEFMRPGTETVVERRRFCRKHSTHPHFGWLRKGGRPMEETAK